tara:strand:- start:18476 stop:19129 length:654 start_codon:yes stop_codon:yes gene_type:complete
MSLYMTKRVWIFGDSYADPNDNSGIEYNFIPWHQRIGKVRNLAKCSTGPHYSLKELYKCYNKFTKDDHVIFIISGRSRIEFYTPTDISVTDYAYKTFEEEIDTFTQKCESFLYIISRLQQCKVTVFLLSVAHSYMKDRLNDDLFYLHNYGLMSASNEEFINGKENKYPRYDLRKNHFSKENHDIMVDIIQTRTFQPFKKNFVDPTPFKQDQEKFIYD